MSNQQIARVDQLKNALMHSRRQITSLLQDESKANKFLSASLVVASNPRLNNCTPDSIVQALVGVAMSDLNVDSNIGHCYLVPYKGAAQLQIGYKGFIQLLYRAGWLVKSFPVYQCDQFDISFDGWDNKVKFVQNLDERQEGDDEWCFKNFRGVYVVARNADTKDEYSAFINKSLIEKLRLLSLGQKGQKNPIDIWKDWYVEMAQAKAIKKLAKTLPIGDPRIQAVLLADDKAEIGRTINYTQTAETGVVIESEKVGQGNDNSYMAEKNEFKKQQSQPLQQLEEKTANDWFELIEQCKTVKDLTLLIVSIPESIQLELQEEIDAKFDLMKQV